MIKTWYVKNQPEKTEIERLKSELNTDETITRLLLQKGIDSKEKAEVFFRPKLEDLHDPFEMKDLNLAVLKINETIQKKEKILLFGEQLQ
jgi:single-stranded-DNA-specific exonuclease